HVNPSVGLAHNDAVLVPRGTAQILRSSIFANNCRRTVGDQTEEGQMKAFSTAAATSVAALMATALLGAAPAQARRGGGGMHFSPAHATISTRPTISSNPRSFVKINKTNTTNTINRTNTTVRRASVHHEPRIRQVTKINKSVLKTVSASRNGTGSGKLTL